MQQLVLLLHEASPAVWIAFSTSFVAKSVFIELASFAWRCNSLAGKVPLLLISFVLFHRLFHGPLSI
jgi:hypothetical protein